MKSSNKSKQKNNRIKTINDDRFNAINTYQMLFCLECSKWNRLMFFQERDSSLNSQFGSLVLSQFDFDHLGS